MITSTSADTFFWKKLNYKCIHYLLLKTIITLIGYTYNLLIVLKNNSCTYYNTYNNIIFILVSYLLHIIIIYNL